MELRRNAPRRQRVEWPTLAVAAVIYLGFAALTWWHALVPWWAFLPAAAVLAAWQGSLQHEIVHGHPTPWRRVNRLLGLPGFMLWVPFGIYKESHLRHHRDTRLTDPMEDPESFYVTPAEWARLGRVRRAILWAHNTLLGRMLVGPVRMIWHLWAGEVRLLAAGDTRHLRHWAWHLPAVTLVLVWALAICGVPVWQYLAGFVYGGASLMLVRSFLEHQAAEEVRERTAIVEAGPLMSLLFLNNNLHVLHHAKPRVPWYRLPRMYRQNREGWLLHNGGYRYRSYAEIALRHLLRPKEPPVHPLMAGPRLEPTGAGDAQSEGSYAGERVL